MSYCNTPDCPNPPAPGRKVCWSCWNYKKRYGLTASDLQAKRAWAAICTLCGKRKKYMDQSFGKPICKGCWMAVRLYRQASWREAAERLLHPPAPPPSQ